MKSEFMDTIFTELSAENLKPKSNVIKSNDVVLNGKSKVAVEEVAHDGIKLILKKDSEDNVKEIKFVCTCGQTKSIVLDYTDQ